MLRIAALMVPLRTTPEESREKNDLLWDEFKSWMLVRLGRRRSAREIGPRIEPKKSIEQARHFWGHFHFH